MCLGVPGKLVRWIERDGPFARGDVEFAGVRRVCYLACVTEANVGDYVLIHAGIAISRIDESEARQLIDDLDRLADADEWTNIDPAFPSPPSTEAEGLA